MQTRAMGPGTGWSWLKRGINLGARNPKAIFGAAALLLVVGLIPTAVQLIAQLGFGMQGPALLSVVGVVMLVSLVVLPPLIGGFLRVIDASEHDRPVAATALFDTYKSGQGAGRMIGFGLIMTAIYIVCFVLLVRVCFGEGFFEWYWQAVSTAAQQGGDPKAVPPVPAGITANFGLFFALSFVFVLFVGGMYAIGFGQVALGSRSVGGAVVDGVVGTLKNLLPILVLAICAFVLGLLLVIGVGLLVMLLALLGNLIHPTLAVVLALPVYIGMLLVLYVVMFGVVYHLWRDVCGSETPTRDDAVAA
ncbi:hypothetical protein [Lysobacter sp. CFH 32150]|uniref:hypothetical protein n=1 Tax=Lysobacter sp. CFH 32150 TaxID=2927128 RepID=UPI001FA7A770|nr:hypothetical protein [Lysobacter sp. CFH 32150]MCI4567908.1 hypothetical protein [Lysobacter sp. CFH 32150]